MKTNNPNFESWYGVVSKRVRDRKALAYEAWCASASSVSVPANSTRYRSRDVFWQTPVKQKGIGNRSQPLACRATHFRKQRRTVTAP